MTPAELDKLEEIAKSATQSSWKWTEEISAVDHMKSLSPGVLIIDSGPGSGGPWGDSIDRANAAHIAAFAPPTVLALIEMIKRG